MILFYGGFEMDVYKVILRSPRAVLLALTYAIPCIFLVALFVKFVFSMRWLQALMLGPMVAGTSSVVIMPLVSRLQITKMTSLTLSLESVATDVFNIVLFYAFLEAYFAAFPTIQEILASIVSKFSVGVVIGLIFGIIWLQVLYKARNEEYVYILTLVTLLCCYVASEYLNGSGVISALLFGLD